MTFFDYFNLISGMCSISGISLLNAFKYFASKSKYMKIAVIKPYVIATTALCLVSLLFTYKPWNKFRYGDQKTIILHDTIKAVTNPITLTNDTSPNLADNIKKRTHRQPQYTLKTPIKKRDTDTSSKKRMPQPGQNGVAVQGNGNHIVAGTGNNVGINGDVNVNKAMLMSPEQLNELFTRVNNQVESKKLKKTLVLETMSFSNAPNVSPQIETYFKEHGYEVNTATAWGSYHEGIFFSTKSGNATIDIGFIVQ